MFKKALTAASLVCICSTAAAEVKPYVLGDLGVVSSDWDNNLTYTLGGGLQFNQHVEFEMAYNDYGDRRNTDISSYSFAFNLGAPVSATTRVYGIVGGEQLRYKRSSGTAKSEEFIVGIGANFQVAERMMMRARLVGHDSVDVFAGTIGVAYYF